MCDYDSCKASFGLTGQAKAVQLASGTPLSSFPTVWVPWGAVVTSGQRYSRRGCGFTSCLSGQSWAVSKAMWLMLQQEEPEDFVISTGEVHSVREFVERAFSHIGKTIVWEGKDEQEIGRCQETGVVHIKVDPKFFRPVEVDFLQGDSTKAYERFGWKPRVTFEALVKEMVESDMELMKNNPNA
uniref:GDP-mannose 4,6-dehydratase n=1 Tax=Knipowitschia caucasica TaxID=637954 RepID=A0AAV2KWU2_KNICA